MPPQRRRSTSSGESGIRFAKRPDPARDNRLRPCVLAVCLRSRVKVGPFWGHSVSTVKRALLELSRKCSCGARFHVPQLFAGRRLKPRPKRPSV